MIMFSLVFGARHHNELFGGSFTPTYHIPRVRLCMSPLALFTVFTYPHVPAEKFHLNHGVQFICIFLAVFKIFELYARRESVSVCEIMAV